MNCGTCHVELRPGHSVILGHGPRRTLYCSSGCRLQAEGPLLLTPDVARGEGL